MTEFALFRAEGDVLVPQDIARSLWREDQMHGVATSGALASGLASWVQAHDPDATEQPVALGSFSLTLLGFAAFFLVMLAWVPITRALPALGMPVAPRLPSGPAATLFYTVVVALLSFVPMWMAQASAIRWARGAGSQAEQGT